MSTQSYIHFHPATNPSFDPAHLFSRYTTHQTVAGPTFGKISATDFDQILRDLPNYTREEIQVKLAEVRAAREKLKAETEALEQKFKSATERHPAINKDSVNGRRWDLILHAAKYHKQCIVSEQVAHLMESLSKKSKKKLEAEGVTPEDIAKAHEGSKKFEHDSANVIKGLKEKIKTVDPRLIG